MCKLEQAISMLKEQNVSCVILRPGKSILSKDMGIKPLMQELRRDRNAFEQCVIADKVIGKAAAMMAVYGGVTAVYGEIMSEDGQMFLEKHHIPYQYGVLVPYIKNRTNTGRCPMEETVLEIEEMEQAFTALEETILRLMKQKEQTHGK